MIRITLLYRYSEGAHLDFDYYVNRHVAMTRRLLSDCGLLSIEVERCTRTLEGGQPDVACVTHLDLERESDLSKLLDKHAATLMADVPNYTNIQPEIYVCEVLTTGK
jgi:uncharacterized protein (TIGR02118 family)